MKTLVVYFCVVMTLLSCKKDEVGGSMYVSGSFNLKMEKDGKNITAYNEQDVQLFFINDKGEKILYHKPNLQAPYGITYNNNTTDPFLNIIGLEGSKMDSINRKSSEQEQVFESKISLKYFEKSIPIKCKFAYAKSYIVIDEIMMNEKVVYDRLKMKVDPIVVDYRSL